MRGAAYYYLTSLVVIAGVSAVGELVIPREGSGMGRGVPDVFFCGDAPQYSTIVNWGYHYAPAVRSSNVAFSPAFPLIGRCVVWVSGWQAHVCLVIVGHAAALAAFILLHAYSRRQEGAATSCERRSAMRRADFVLLAMGLWPTTVFFRVPQTEPLMLLMAIAAMYAMRRGAWPGVVALIVGLGTACRPVGVALLGPFVVYLWERAGEHEIPRCAQNDNTQLAFARAPAQKERVWRFVGRCALWLPLACWGIAAFMIFQYIEFGDALAWTKAQQNWSKRPGSTYLEQWGYALILEPIWSVYLPSSPAYWAKHVDAPANPLFNLPFANPIYFVVSVYLVWFGWRKKWLDRKEVLLAALLLGIPYFSHGYRHMMLSQGRFAAVAFPVYIVMGRLMARAPAPLVAVACALSGGLLAAYAALFAGWYRMT